MLESGKQLAQIFLQLGRQVVQVLWQRPEKFPAERIILLKRTYDLRLHFLVKSGKLCGKALTQNPSVVGVGACVVEYAIDIGHVEVCKACCDSLGCSK